MKNIYLRVEHCDKDGKILLAEYHSATMDKNFVYFDKYKVQIEETKEYDEKDRNLHDRPARCIKVYASSKSVDERFIWNE